MTATASERARAKLERVISGKGAGDLGELGDSPRQKPVYSGRRAGDFGRLSKGSVAKAMRFARSKLAAEGFDAPTYPVEALGPLADACRAIAQGGQMHSAMAGQSLLTTAACSRNPERMSAR